MGLPHATALVAGTIIGAAIFVQPSEISRHVPSAWGTLLVWLLSGALTLCGALVCAELASAFPRTGGVYVFLRESFSPAAGFLWGWAMFWSMHSGIIAAIAVVFGRYVGYFVPLGGAGIRVVAAAGILILSAVNYAGVRQGSNLQALLTLVKVIAVVILIVLLFALGPPARGPGLAPASPQVTVGGLVLALSAGLFAFGGWHMVTYTAEETRHPERTIPRALLIGTLAVTACYLALNLGYLRALPVEQLTESSRVAADAAQAVAGPRAAATVSALVVVSSFGALSGIVLAGPRVYLAMAQDGLMFRWAGAIHPVRATPHRAILLQALWSCVLVATDTYRGLFTRVIYTEWIFFALMAAGMMRLRRRAGYSPACRAWGYPVTPLLFIAGSLVIVGQQVAANPLGCAAGLLLVAAGLPVYAWWARPGARKGAAGAGH